MSRLARLIALCGVVVVTCVMSDGTASGTPGKDGWHNLRVNRHARLSLLSGAEGIHVFENHPYKQSHVVADIMQIGAPIRKENRLVGQEVRLRPRENSRNPFAWSQRSIANGEVAFLRKFRSYHDSNRHHIKSGGIPMIFHLSLDDGNPHSAWGHHNFSQFNRNVGSKLPLPNVLGRLDGFTSEFQRPKKSSSAYGGQSELSQCGYYLPFTGSSSPFRSGGALLLGFQIFLIMSFGAVFLCFGTLGLYRVFHQPNRDRRWANWVLASVFLPAGVIFYAWGYTGHPGLIWGLCN